MAVTLGRCFFFAIDDQRPVLFHFLEPLGVLLLQPGPAHPARQHRIQRSRGTNRPQVQMDEEEGKDHHKPQGVEDIHQPHDHRGKAQGEPHHQSREEHDGPKSRHGQKEHLLARIVLTSFGNLIHMPKIAAGAPDPFQIFGHGKNPRLFPPHADGEVQGHAEEDACEVMNVFQGLEASHHVADKIQGLIHHPQPGDT